MIESLKITPMLQKIHHLDPSVMSAKDALKMATIEGAKALGISDIVGSIEPGKRADIALFSNTAELAIINDPYQQLVFGTSPRSVSDVWVSIRQNILQDLTSSISCLINCPSREILLNPSDCKMRCDL